MDRIDELHASAPVANIANTTIGKRRLSTNKAIFIANSVVFGCTPQGQRVTGWANAARGIIRVGWRMRNLLRKSPRRCYCRTTLRPQSVASARIAVCGFTPVAVGNTLESAM